MSSARTRLRRWHVWLGWIVALPILFWTISGLVMVIRPIDEVRGEHLVAPPLPLRLEAQPVLPSIEGVALESLSLEQRAAGPRWVIELPDGTTRLADPATGMLLPPISAADAAAEVMARYQGQSQISTASRIDPQDPPIDYRRQAPAWQVAMADGTNFYVDAGSGEITVTRTRWWRVHDWMWGLHIMDLETREDSHNPLVVAFGIAALLMSLLALLLLPMTARWRRRPRRSS